MTHFRLPSVIWWKTLKAISCFFCTTRLILRYVLLLVWAKVTRKSDVTLYLKKTSYFFLNLTELLGNRGTRIKQMDFAFYASWNIILFSDQYDKTFSFCYVWNTQKDSLQFLFCKNGLDRFTLVFSKFREGNKSRIEYLEYCQHAKTVHI